jgi:hypothetical protein
MVIENYGTGARCEGVLRRLLNTEAPEGCRRIKLLPIPTSRDGANLTGTDISVLAPAIDLDGSDLVCGYAIPEYARDAMLSSGARVYDGALDEEFLSKNARLTAIGALAYILGSIKAEPADISFGVIGYGRIGSLLSSYLLFLGARLTVYTTRHALRLRLGENGIGSVLIGDPMPSLCGVDILINTAPIPLSNGFPDGVIPQGMRVIELASGENFGDIKGIERLPSIPDRMYPESSATVYFEAIKKYMNEVF